MNNSDVKEKRRLTRGDKIFIAVFNPLLALIIAFAIIFIPPYMTYRTVFIEDSVYDNVFVAALGDKYARLKSIEAPKIAVVGGSSVAFGLDSEELSRHTGREVVNFGLFATLGSKIMLDLSEDGLRAGDIVVFAPELDEKTLSLYFGARSAWQAIDASRELYDTVYRHNGEELEAEKAAFVTEKREYLKDGAPDPSGVYNRKSFNTYGDISYPRPYNTMALGYDPNTTFTLTPEIVSEDFLEYFNSYCERLRQRGVTVYFSFCPINDMSLAEGTTEESLNAMQEYLEGALNCKVISSLSDYIIDWGYFYDTNLHLNDAGVKLRTERLINDLRFALDISGDVSLGVPDAPGLLGSETISGDNAHSSLFTYDVLMMGDTVMGAAITGLTDEGRSFEGEELIIPSTTPDGVQVIILRADVLSGLKGLKTVKFGANISSIDDYAFRGCSSLEAIYIDFDTSCLVSLPGDNAPAGLMEGAPEGCLIYCKEEYRNDFLNHYTWQHYYKYFAK
ncbi:MAG: hypothetical protein IKD45_04930 [Clostridia bacterium]|nr:hypothetical protein [Clostridia bacterium]